MFSFSKKILLTLVATFICFAPLAAGAAPAPSPTPAATVTDKSGTKFIAPAMELGVKIPGLTFDPVTETNGLIQVNFLAQYIGAVFNYLVAISVIAASIMIVYGGFLTILGANGMKVTEGKNKIKDALIGLFLILGAYTIISALNKSLVTLKVLEIPAVKTEVTYLSKNGTTGPPSGSGGGMNGAPPSKYAWQNKLPGSLLPPTEIKPEDRVNMSSLPKYDTKQSAVANIDQFCTKGAKETKGYMAKIKLLVKAVLGYGATCAEHHQCAYAQGGGTTISDGRGKITAAPYAGYAVDFLEKNNIATISDIWASPETKYCADKYTKEGSFSINADPVCSAKPLALYQKYIVATFEEKQLFVSDCGQFVWAVYNCAGAAYQNLPTQKQWDNVKKQWVLTSYYDSKAIELVKDYPAMIVAAHMNEDLDAIAAKKGGLKFGDVVYIHEGMMSHYLLYTGGRPEVGYSFMDMGGGQGAIVENTEWGSIKTTAGVQGHPPGMTLQDHINTLVRPKPILKTSGAPTGSFAPSEYKGDDGVVFVWRPYTEDATEAAGTSDAPPI